MYVDFKATDTHVRLKVLMVMKMQVVVFWVVMPCNVVVEYQCFGEPCCLQDEDGDSKVLQNFGLLLSHHFMVS
jgi:hypothetical protein